jgi:phosphatidate cytidylyltransferase
LGAAAALHQTFPAETLWNVRTPLLLAVVPVWAGDIAGIFVGRAWGRRPLAPQISPNKTVEGAVGNLLACLAAGAALGVWTGFGPGLGLAAGALGGTFGQAGDLFESSLKRSAGVKDSGNLLPGHGGILDRIDSLLFALPVVAVLLIFASR